MRKIVLGIFILIMLTITYTSADLVFGINVYGQLPAEVEDGFSINAEPLDKSTILVTGHAPRMTMEPVQITITAPNVNLVGIDQLIVDSDFNYMTKIKTSAKSWNVNGAYVITAYQSPGGLHRILVSTNIEIVDGLIADFKLDYQIDGGFVSYIEVEPNSNSLIISIDTKIYDDTSGIFFAEEGGSYSGVKAGGSYSGVEAGGVLTIELPRKVIDATILGTDFDDHFIVFVDGVNTPFEEVSSSSVRSLTIPFPSGSEEIKVTGTYVDPEFAIYIVPEFGILAPLVLFASVAVIVVLSQKGKVSILYPKQ